MPDRLLGSAQEALLYHQLARIGCRVYAVTGRALTSAHCLEVLGTIADMQGAANLGHQVCDEPHDPRCE